MNAIHTRTALGAALMVNLVIALNGSSAQSGEPRSASEGAYTTAQIKRGAALYAQKCETCHGQKLIGGEAPPLAGADFMANWTAYSVGDLFEKLRNTMPANDPRSLNNQEYADIIALILSANQFPSGSSELPGTPERLKQIRFESTK